MSKPTCKPTNDLSIELWQSRMEINKMNSKKKTQPRGQCQDKISERVTFSKQENDAELPYHLLPKHTQQAMIINAFSLNEKSSAIFKLVGVSITSEYSNGSFKVSEGAQFTPMITASVKAASTFFNVEVKLIVKSASDALHSEGAQITKLIFASINSKIYLRFHNNSRIFCEGEWWSTTSKTCSVFT